jgi:PDDEXK-like uncharacterized protein DUF3799
VTRAEYDALPGVNWSTLKHMQRSPAHYRYALENGTQPHTDAMALGTVTHLAVFEPEKLETHVAVWEGRRAGAEWESFRDAALDAGQELIKAEPFQLAQRLGMLAREAAGKLLSAGQSEVPLTWTHTNGLFGKGRLDHISRGYGIIDLKTCVDASPIGFGRRAAALGYHIQAAYYVDGAEKAGWGRLPYTILAIEKTAPHGCALYTVTEDHLDLGRSIYEPLLDQVKACLDKGAWPAYAPSVLTLPKWAEYDASSDSLDGLGLTFEET